jgi:hypothetical protein
MNWLKKAIYIFLLSGLGGFANASVPVDSLDKIVVSDLTGDWLIYNPDYESFFPYLSDQNKGMHSISLLIDLEKYKSYNLNFSASPGLSLFIDQKLFYNNNSEESRLGKISIDKLLKLSDSEKQLITFYNSSGNLPLNCFYIGHSPLQVISFDPATKPLSAIPRKIVSGQNIFIITFLIIFIIVAIIRNRYPKKFSEFTNFGNIIPSADNDVLWDLSSTPVLLFVLINSLCSALILFLIYDQFHLDTLNFLNIFYEKPVWGILIASGGFFMVYIMKFIYLQILAWIFNVSELVKIQFFELMKVSLKVNMFLAVLTMVFYCSQYFYLQMDFDYFFYFTIVSLIIVLLRVGYLSFKLSGFRNIYLFSYLCTTEILPLVIIVKMILF